MLLQRHRIRILCYMMEKGMQAQTVTIVGMGRVGVSIARALRASEAGLTIVGHDRIRQLAE